MWMLTAQLYRVMELYRGSYTVDEIKLSGHMTLCLNLNHPVELQHNGQSK